MFYQSIQYKFSFSLVAILIRELLLQLLSIKGADERSSSQKILKPFNFILLLQLLLFKGADECSSSQQILNPVDIILLLHLLLIKGADERTFKSLRQLNNFSISARDAVSLLLSQQFSDGLFLFHLEAD